jgi:hypothetical protein
LFESGQRDPVFVSGAISKLFALIMDRCGYNCAAYVCLTFLRILLASLFSFHTYRRDNREYGSYLG